MLLSPSEGIAESLIMNDLTLAQILDGIAHIGIVNETKDVVVGYASLLFCCYCINTICFF